MADVDAKISFKKKSRRPMRTRRDSDDEESEEMNTEDFQKTRELQKLRKRTAGTNIETLAAGKKQCSEEDDPLGLKRGGLLDTKAMKDYKAKDDAYDVGTQFSKETHIRDEDDEMRKFIETEMSKMKGRPEVADEEEEDESPQFLAPEDAALLSLPSHLTKSTFKKDQQMISAQMLTGIPEVDLGIDVKIQNIERTEKAKKKLLEESKLRENQREQKHLEKSSNYVQHDRWKDIQEIEMVRESQGKNQQKTERPNTVNIYAEPEQDLFLRDERLKGAASDDKVMNKFKDLTKNSI